MVFSSSLESAECTDIEEDVGDVLRAHIGQGASWLPKQSLFYFKAQSQKRRCYSSGQSEALSWTGTWRASRLQDAAGVSLSDQAPPGPEIEKRTVDFQKRAKPALPCG